MSSNTNCLAKKDTTKSEENEHNQVNAFTTVTQRPGIKYQNQLQVPTPGPRKNLRCNNQPLIERDGIEIGIVEEQDREASSNQQVKLVKIRDLNERDLEESASGTLVDTPRQISICYESKKRTSFPSRPSVKCFSDEHVINSAGINDIEDYDEDNVHNEDEDDYYEEDYDGTGHQDELTNLSRQSMVPLNELIAYYKYIQQGDNHVAGVRNPVNLRASKAFEQKITTNTTSKIHFEEIPVSIYNTGSSSIEPEVDVSDDQRQPDDDDFVHESPSEKTQNDQLQSDHSLDQQDEELSNAKLDSEQNIVQALALQENRRRVRANVVLELINSERDFVGHLKNVVEGYLHPARKHPEIFSCERINTIFSNIEQLFEFQRTFLDTMETCINWGDLAQSEVGQCFLEYEKGFSVYHHYCNNHPNATSELQELYTKPRFVKFFEACRLLQNMIDISLDGFLLTPIQKICKYPLQLSELLKNTNPDHPDYKNVVDALESMRNCANLANERKRRIEALADVMSFQEKVENWWGPKLSDTSSILIHSGEVSKMSSHTWSQGIQLHLFDHLLLISKKDLLKRNNLILKARVNMDTVTEISDADEYKPKKSFKLYCGEQRRWFVFTTRSEQERDEWINAFEKERNLVEADENEGFHITEREIGVARRALQNRKHSRSARYRHKRPDTAIVDQLDLDDANTIMNRTLSLPSCIHPSHVMNFVEDSKVIPSRKKNISPNSSTLSPVAGSQNLFDHEQTSGGWFKKMGSKKLSISQIYNINGPTGSTSGSATIVKSRTTSPTNIILDTTAKYDQLEKKHRDHMVSEEQARLYRLNNDLPPSIFKSSFSSVTNPTNSCSNNRTSRASMPHLYRQTELTHKTRQRLSQAKHPTISTNPDPQIVSDNKPLNVNRDQIVDSSKHTFETTVVLACGKVVRVREDAV